MLENLMQFGCPLSKMTEMIYNGKTKWNCIKKNIYTIVSYQLGNSGRARKFFFSESMNKLIKTNFHLLR